MRTFHPTPILACLVLLGPVSIGAAELVMLTPVEGTPVTGELVSADGEKVVLRVGEGAEAHEQTFAWEQVKRMSNGLTREKALLKLAESHPELLCPDCRGQRTTTCAQCQGKGLDLNAPKGKCATCEGTGKSACAAAACREGRVPCTGPCLKLNSGQWVKKNDGLRWRTFTYPGGWAAWSEKHCGEVIEIQNGKPVNRGKCKLCNGTTKMPCPKCEGTGKAECESCHGTKEAPAPCPACQMGKVPCATCKGSGLKP